VSHVEKRETSCYSWAEIGFNYQLVNEKLLHEEHKLLSASIIRRQRTILANYIFFFSGIMFIQILCLFAVFVTCDNRWVPFFSPTTSIPVVLSKGFFFSAVRCLDRVYFLFFFWLKESVRPLRGVSELLFERLCVDGVL